MAMVLVYVMMTGHRMIAVLRSSDMPTVPYIWENVGPTVPTVTDQSSTTVTDAKNTAFSTRVFAHATKTGLEKIAANIMVVATANVTDVPDLTPMTVSTVSLTPMKTVVDTVYVKPGTDQLINTTMAPGEENSVIPGQELVLLAVPPVQVDTSQNNVRHVTSMLTSMRMVSAHVTLTGLATAARST